MCGSGVFRKGGFALSLTEASGHWKRAPFSENRVFEIQKAVRNWLKFENYN